MMSPGEYFLMEKIKRQEIEARAKLAKHREDQLRFSLVRFIRRLLQRAPKVATQETGPDARGSLSGRHVA